VSPGTVSAAVTCASVSAPVLEPTGPAAITSESSIPSSDPSVSAPAIVGRAATIASRSSGVAYQAVRSGDVMNRTRLRSARGCSVGSSSASGSASVADSSAERSSSAAPSARSSDCGSSASDPGDSVGSTVSLDVVPSSGSSARRAAADCCLACWECDCDCGPALSGGSAVGCSCWGPACGACWGPACGDCWGPACGACWGWFGPGPELIVPPLRCSCVPPPPPRALDIPSRW